MTALLSPTEIEVCPLERLIPGRGVAALLPDGRQIAVYLLDDGSVHALCNIDPIALERGRMTQLQQGYDHDSPSTLRGLAYVAFQELATRISHRNTGRYSDDPVADRRDLGRHLGQHRAGRVAAAPRVPPGLALPHDVGGRGERRARPDLVERRLQRARPGVERERLHRAPAGHDHSSTSGRSIPCSCT